MSRYQSFQHDDVLRYDGRNRYLNKIGFNKKANYSFIKFINDIYFGRAIIIKSKTGFKYLVPEDLRKHFKRRFKNESKR